MYKSNWYWMSYLGKLLEGIFGEQKQEMKDGGCLLTESINPKDLFCENYHKWLKHGIHTSMFDHYLEEYKKHLQKDKANFFTYRSKNSNGFYFRKEPYWDKTDYGFLTQLIIEKMKAQDYVLKNSHREIVEEGGLLKCIEQFYLKPSLKYRREKPFEQFFGNIEIQHRMVNEETALLKVMANSYQDSAYKRAYDFEDLIHYIFVI